MTSFGTYDAGLPCRNPNCKSHGKPHPNCRCYGDMAEGGEVLSACRRGTAHDSNCQYFLDGPHSGELSDMHPMHAVAGHMAHGGIVGMLRLHDNEDLGHYENTVKRGHKTIDAELDGVIKGTKLQALEDRSRFHKIIDDFISKGGVTHHIQQEVYEHSPSYADGGEVKKERVFHNHPIQHVYPEQNVAIQAAKGRVSNYLSALRPEQNLPKLPFDDHPDQSQRKKTYEKAMKIADAPLSILREISHGKIEPEEIAHLDAMYPEVKESLQQKMTEKIIEAQLEGKKPPAKIRQSLSLLMGTPLSSEFTAASIQAAQSTFQIQPKQSQSVQTQKGTSKAKLTKSDQAYLTKDQALIRRSQKI